ncbi:DUF1995 family protein [Gloeobacter violaceus]|uniref:Gll3249 protein n=1 Tax=Gloeobacter violaceus (strain ATCC 29082 / PCC 7421) TaxID=251221 RepID=Q7NGC3_GLOVI|nr:DUF1995 family protein [Gloeobacter violaceus]BAC91190.1 gll3249 [Gloeobacter violaceus PCC 7421]
MICPLPETFEQALLQAQRSVRNALEAGRTRLQVEIQTGRKSATAITRPLLDVLPQPLLAVSGTGIADYAYTLWGETPYKLLNISEREFIGNSWRSLVLMDASSIDVDEVQIYAERARVGDKVLMMVNNWPEGPGLTGVGRGKESTRNAFRGSVEVAYFLQAFRYRPVVLFRRFPEPWQLWERKEDRFILVRESQAIFTPRELAAFNERMGPLQAVERFFKGPSFFDNW